MDRRTTLFAGLARPVGVLVTAFTLALGGANTLVAQEGFLVLRPLPDGEAAIYVNGQSQGVLQNQEMTIPLPPGEHRLIARRDGYHEFSRQVRIESGEPLPVSIQFVEAEVRVIEGGDAAGGAVGREMGTLRVVHLDPVDVPVVVGGRQLGSTPLTLELPTGIQELRIGATRLCLYVRAAENSYVRLRRGTIEEVENTVPCEDIWVQVEVVPLPAGYSAHSHQEPGSTQSTFRPGGALGTVVVSRLPPGRHELLLQHEEYPDFVIPVEAAFGDRIRVEVDLPDPPELIADTIRPRAPELGMEHRFTEREPSRPGPRPAVVRRLEDQIRQVETYRGGEGRGSTRVRLGRLLAVVGGGAVLAALLAEADSEGSDDYAALGWGGVGAGLLGIYLSGDRFDPSSELSSAQFQQICGEGARRRNRSSCIARLESELAQEQSRGSNPELIAAYEEEHRAWLDRRAAFEENLQRRIGELEPEIQAYEERRTQVQRNREENRRRYEEWTRHLIDPVFNISVQRGVP